MSCSVPKARIEHGDLRGGEMIEVLTRQARAISNALDSTGHRLIAVRWSRSPPPRS